MNLAIRIIALRIEELGYTTRSRAFFPSDTSEDENCIYIYRELMPSDSRKLWRVIQGDHLLLLGGFNCKTRTLYTWYSPDGAITGEDLRFGSYKDFYAFLKEYNHGLS